MTAICQLLRCLYINEQPLRLYLLTVTFIVVECPRKKRLFPVITYVIAGLNSSSVASVFFLPLSWNQKRSVVLPRNRKEAKSWRLSCCTEPLEILSAVSDQSDSRTQQRCVVYSESHLVKEHGDRPVSGEAGKPRSSLWSCDFTYVPVYLRRSIFHQSMKNRRKLLTFMRRKTFTSPWQDTQVMSLISAQH